MSGFKRWRVKCLILASMAAGSLFADRSWALDSEVAALVRFETRGNAVSLRSDSLIPIENYEIPLEALEQDIAGRLPPNVRASLIFERGGKKYVRWIVNPEDTKWHKEVEKWLDKKKIPKIRHQYFKAYMTASRSYILEDPKTGAQFSAKVSTNQTGGAWRDKKQPIDDARQVRMGADYVFEGLSREKMKHTIVMDEPAMFGIADIDQAMLVRTLNGLVEEDHYYLPGFSAVNDRVGTVIARKNGATDVAEFWNEHYNKPLGRALAEFTARFGLTYDSPHSQNFLVELDKDLKPTGKIVLRDFGDTYASSDFFTSRNRTNFLTNWEIGNITNRELQMSIGVLHGNDLPSWLSEQQYVSWGRDFFEAYEQELSTLTGVPRSEIQDKMFISGRYFSKNYSTRTPGWIKYFGGKLEADGTGAMSSRRPKGPTSTQIDSAIMDQIQKLAANGDTANALRLLSKCMQQFHNMQIPDPGNPR